MKNKYLRLFLEEDGDNAGGGMSVVDLLPRIGESAKEEVVDETPASEAAESEVVEQKPSTSFTMDPDTLAAALQKAGIGQPAAQTQQKAPLTPEQLADARKALKFFEVKPEFLTKFNNMDTQAAALEEFRDGLTEQFATMMAAYFGDQRQQLRQEYAPALTYMQQQEAERQEAAFNKTYEQLAAPALQPVRDAVITHLKQQIATGAMQPFADAKSRDAAIASGMTSIIKSSNPGFTLSPGSTPTKTTNPNAIKPAPQRGGGGGGGSSSNADTTSGVPKAVGFLPRIR